MDIPEEEGYEPETGFEVDSREPLVDISLSDSTELWLIKWPPSQLPDFHGRELVLSLNDDGCLGSFEGSSVYDVASIVGKGPDAMVFQSIASETKYVGNISRLVSLVHAPEPKELEQEEAEKKSKRLSHMSGGSSLINSYHSATPTQSTKLRNTFPSRRHPASTHSSRHKSSISEVGEQMSVPKKRHKHQRTASTDPSTLDSGKGHNNHTVSGS